MANKTSDLTGPCSAALVELWRAAWGPARTRTTILMRCAALRCAALRSFVKYVVTDHLELDHGPLPVKLVDSFTPPWHQFDVAPLAEEIWT